MGLDYALVYVFLRDDPLREDRTNELTKNKAPEIHNPSSLCPYLPLPSTPFEARCLQSRFPRCHRRCLDHPVGFLPDPESHMVLPTRRGPRASAMAYTNRGALLLHHPNLRHVASLHDHQPAHLSSSISRAKRRPR